LSYNILFYRDRMQESLDNHGIGSKLSIDREHYEESFQVIAKGSSQDVGSISPIECSNQPGSAGLGFPREERTECELEKWNDCKDLRGRVGQTNWGEECDEIDEIFMDDDCLGFNSQRECDRGYNDPPDCDVANPPPECVPTECPDGRIMPPGEPCPDDALPCDDPDAPEGCSVPTECPDGSIIPPGEQCPDEDPPDEDPPDEDPPDEDPPEDGGGNDDDNGGRSSGDGDADAIN
jgi:hypothetical protein